jgi:hypothetical protein
LSLIQDFLKGHDPAAYFKQVRAVKGNPAIVSTYHGVTYLLLRKLEKANRIIQPAEAVRIGQRQIYGKKDGR